MLDQPNYVEWKEPPRSPENRDFYVTYRQFVRMIFEMLRRQLFGLVGFLLAAVFVTFVVTKHSSPVRMTLAFAGFLLVMMLAGLITCHLGYLCTFRVQRHVRLSRTDVICLTLAKKELYSFTDATRILIEPVDKGDHRVVIEGERGELCRLRVPSGFDVDSITRLIPEGKLVRRNSAAED